MIALDALHQLPFKERLLVMEALWEGLSPAASGLPVPQWQQEVLDEREARVAEGTARYIDWGNREKGNPGSCEMKIQILELAKGDLAEGCRFYEEMEAGLGGYFLEHLYADIETLATLDEMHPQSYRHFHRALSKRFPVSIFYTLEDGVVKVRAIGVPPAVSVDEQAAE